MNPATHPENTFDALLSSTLHILSKAASSSDPRWSLAVLQHLYMLVEHPDCEHGILRKNLEKLVTEWTTLNQSSRMLH